MTLKNGTEKKEGKPMPKPWENAEGYHDPAVFELLNRIEIKDRKTGREYR